MNEVIWYDAVQKEISRELLETLNEKSSGIKFLAVNKTYGKVIKLKDVICVVHEESTHDDTDVTFIPKTWVISIK